MFNRCLSFLKIKAMMCTLYPALSYCHFIPSNNADTRKTETKKKTKEGEEEEKAKYNTHKAMNVKD